MLKEILFWIVVHSFSVEMLNKLGKHWIKHTPILCSWLFEQSSLVSTRGLPIHPLLVGSVVLSVNPDFIFTVLLVSIRVDYKENRVLCSMQSTIADTCPHPWFYRKAFSNLWRFKFIMFRLCVVDINVQSIYWLYFYIFCYLLWIMHELRYYIEIQNYLV